MAEQSRHYEREIETLHEKLSEMVKMTEEMTDKSIEALISRDSVLAKKMIDYDDEVNAKEIEIDEYCIRLLALYQPAASDLRFITTTLKMVTDLERMSDLGVNICERALRLNKVDPIKTYDDLPKMAEAVKKMLIDVHKAFVEKDTVLALKVIDDDDIVDDVYAKVINDILRIIENDSSTAEVGYSFLSAAKHLERIGDHITNIAELVVYYVDGKVIKHQPNL